MGALLFITHPEVTVDPDRAVTDWALNGVGRARAEQFAKSPRVAEVTAIWASAERKAQQTAQCLATTRGLTVFTDARLGENDRRATGFLPPDRFEAAADAFFAHPDASFQGWETARAAQSRIAAAVRQIANAHSGGDLAIVSHGAVGTLLFCALRGLAISRSHDQPGQGHYWSADLCDLVPEHGWRPLT